MFRQRGRGQRFCFGSIGFVLEDSSFAKINDPVVLDISSPTRVIPSPPMNSMSVPLTATSGDGSGPSLPAGCQKARADVGGRGARVTGTDAEGYQDS